MQCEAGPTAGVSASRPLSMGLTVYHGIFGGVPNACSNPHVAPCDYPVHRCTIYFLIRGPSLYECQSRAKWRQRENARARDVLMRLSIALVFPMSPTTALIGNCASLLNRWATVVHPPKR